MIFQKTKLFLVLLLGLMLLNCSNQQKKTEINLKNLKKKLQKGQLLIREEPFKQRVFKPHLNGDWIGEAVSYGCYRKGQAPGVKGPSEEEILEDLNIIMNYWNLVRIYGSDDDAERILKVIRENQLPIKVMLGVWLENEENNPAHRKANIEQTSRGIQLANEYDDIVLALNVGNETQVFWSWHRMNMQNLIRYIRAVRQNVAQPITTADDYNFWNKPESKKISREVDFIVAHLYPLWNGLTLEKAMYWTDSVYQSLKNYHPNKEIVVGEIGWATDYNAEKKGPGEQGSLIKGEVSLKAQKTFLIQLHEWVSKNHVTTFWFEAFDEPWKGGGDQTSPNEIEKNWGVFYENRTPKPSFVEFTKFLQMAEINQ